MRVHGSIIFVLLVLSACTRETPAPKSIPADTTNQKPARFTLLHAQQTHVDFVNTLTEGPNTNILVYEYFYNGGGVAAGDLNGDGKIDLYFTANMSANKLYLNKGNMAFEDVTASSGAEGRTGPWKTGVTFADVNGDGKLDIYISYSGMVRDENRVNQLFINEGNNGAGVPHFKEQAEEFGLASAGFSNQIYFFDYDRDGDLDAILLNHNPNALPILNEVSTAEFLKKDDLQKGVRLYKQTNGKFKDVTNTAGISGSALTYGLGVGISDVNNDGWTDFYISNDYAVPDYLYINNKNGTFTDKLQVSLGHSSQFSMGNDVGDINNDGWSDIVTLDMLPEDNRRQKLLMGADNYEKFDLNLRTGFYYQYMRNMLHVSNSNGTFSEIGQFAGISNTDWSWSALLADYDNDGWKDLFVTNGYYRDYTNMDFIKYMDDVVKEKGRLKREDVLEIIAHMPASNVINYIFANDHGTTFTNQTRAWGMERSSNSNGAAYADLDNDGDLDLVINNINQPAFIYQNESSKEPDNHYLQIMLQGEGKNTQGLGAKVVITAGGKKQFLEQVNTRGYLSSVSPVLHVGLGLSTTIDTLVVFWPRGKQQLLVNVAGNQQITLKEASAVPSKMTNVHPDRPLFVRTTSPVVHAYPKNTVNDFKRQALLFDQPSFRGPCLAKGDVNGDGMEDIYAGGVSGQAGALFIQQKGNRFSKITNAAFEEDKRCEDAEAVFFDANGDGHPDLYVASGGYHAFSKTDEALQDRLYLNNGKGNFVRSKDALPEIRGSKGCVAILDINSDGHPDVFVGGRIVPGMYPETPASYLLMNDGHGKFSEEISSVAIDLQQLGMITDAITIDLNNDKKDDLVVAGEWIPVSVFINTGGQLKNETDKYFDKRYSGWWNSLATGDFNHDGKPDLMVGNMGTNTQLKAADDKPVELYFKDFDNNGSVDAFLCYYIQGKSYPFVTRDELLDQVGSFRKRFVTYKSYADVSLTDIFKPDELSQANRLTANHLETTLFLSSGGEKFTVSVLPEQAQYAPVHTLTVIDYNNDGHDDVLLCGNNNQAKIRMGKSDANYGVLLRGNGKGGFEYVNQEISGFALRGDVRSVINIKDLLIFGIGQQPVTVYKRMD